ncbi:transcriptional regulator [Ralstonia solanacearum]|uniref:ogr/Delta-like zinc finger family protein n=1 Tax=Ralstonia solanacearum TaxID=305 RepID=UPI000E660446|nr:ogr/Delta-like zinc finger family protein [Ralstonia solanacearum]RIJ88259.1 transcriptional regulator [Ralstonia solanacearum]
MKINCPHCGSVATIRTSRPVSRITRELYCQCSNVICGHTFVSLVEVVRTHSPSSTPDPEVARQLAGRYEPVAHAA